jgi:hypothetical protein
MRFTDPLIVAADGSWQIAPRELRANKMIRNFALIAVSLALAAMGCAHNPSMAAKNESVKTLWHFRYQYVRLEPQDTCSDQPAVPNAHPIRLKAEELRAALASLRLSIPDHERPTAVFTRAELDTLVPPMVEAFREADAGEDVAIAIEGAHPASIGYRRSMTTARLFYRDGRLNVIVGCLHAPINDFDSPLHVENTDRRLKPFPQASRCHAAVLKGTWVASTLGFGLHEQNGGQRNDWLTLALGQGAVDMAAPPSVATPVPGKGTSSDQRIVERLKILKQLKDQDLITDQEYKAKKQEILKSL